jgi:hypothetical protein
MVFKRGSILEMTIVIILQHHEQNESKNGKQFLGDSRLQVR